MQSKLKKSNSSQNLQQRLHIQHNQRKKSGEKQIRLSHLIIKEHKERQKQTKQNKMEKLSFVHQHIQVIDQLPCSYYCYYENVKTLYLSGNSIGSLQNIQHFAHLESLSLANNQISQLCTIRYLQPLSRLNNLILQNNPIAKLTMYIPFTIGIVRNLRMVDHIIVQSVSKECMLEIFAAYQDIIGLMLKNYTALFKLVYVYRKLDIHSVITQAKKRIQNQRSHYLEHSSLNQFIQSNQQQCIQQQQPYFFDVNKFLQLCQSCSDLPVNVLLSYQNTLYCDLQSMKIKLNSQLKNISKYELFFSVMHILHKKQTQKLQQLKSRIMQRSSPLCELRNSINKSKQQDIQKVQQIFQKLYLSQNENIKLARVYRDTNMMQKCYKILYLRVLKRQKKVIATNKIVKALLFHLITVIYRPFFRHLYQVNRQEALQNFVVKLNDTVVNYLKNQILSQIKVYSNTVRSFNLIFAKIQCKNQIKQQFRKFVNNIELMNATKQNHLLMKQLKQFKAKQEKYKEKIKLLEKLLQISQQKHINSINRISFQDKIFTINRQEQISQKKYKRHINIQEKVQKKSRSEYQNIARFDVTKNDERRLKQNLDTLNEHKPKKGQNSQKTQRTLIQRKLNQSRRNKTSYSND